jgi:hypothetical protein
VQHYGGSGQTYWFPVVAATLLVPPVTIRVSELALLRNWVDVSAVLWTLVAASDGERRGHTISGSLASV